MSRSTENIETAYRDVTLLGRAMVASRIQVETFYPAVDKKRDARINAFGRCANVCVSTSLGLGLFLQYLQSDEWWQGNVSPPMPYDAMRDVRYEFQQFQKLGFVHFSYMAIESALRVFNTTVDPRFVDRNFKNIYDNLLKRLKLTKYRCLLDLLRLIRNTLHTNG